MNKTEIINDIIELRKVARTLGRICSIGFDCILKNNGQKAYYSDEYLKHTLNNKLKNTLYEIRSQASTFIDEY